MDYALAKELKEAGFPYNSKPHEAFADGSGQGNLILKPTLEELIEACGRVWVGPCDQGWHSGFDGHPFSHLAEDKPQGCGSTPTEAVARLWLALNKKS